jgi:Zn-dependent membrane protease YugP
MLILPLILIIATVMASKWAQGRYAERMAMGHKAQAPENLTAEQIAQEFLHAHGVTDVQTVKHNGIVTNYYDPGRRRLYLHGDILSGKTLSCWALALHEAAHALQKGEDGDSFQWRRTCIRLTRYVPMLAVFGTAALMFFMKIPFRNSMMIFIAICVLIMLMNLGTLAVEHNANARLRRWLEERLSSSPVAQERIEVLLAAIATRELGDLVQSPRYFFLSALPGTSSARP